jgi:hypothetical protein
MLHAILRLSVAITGISGVCVATSPQIAGQPVIHAPEHFVSASPIGLRAQLPLPHNTPSQLRKELLDANTISIIVQRAGVAPTAHATFTVAPDVAGNGLALYLLSTNAQEACKFAKWLDLYVQGRLEGHTSSCLLTGITNNATDGPLDSDLAVLIKSYPLLPKSWFHRAGAGALTNSGAEHLHVGAGDDGSITTLSSRLAESREASRWVSYDLVDDDVAWNFILEFSRAGEVVSLRSIRFDAKEIEPGLVQVFREVDNELSSELRAAGGRIHSPTSRVYWRLKKERLKLKGIEWKSPAELNPGTIFD